MSLAEDSDDDQNRQGTGRVKVEVQNSLSQEATENNAGELLHRGNKDMVGGMDPHSLREMKMNSLKINDH